MSILDNAKEVVTAVHEIKNLELYERVLNLNAGIMDLVEENRKLKGEKEELEKKVKLREAMKFKAPFYYQEGDDTPFCPSCFESNKHEAVHVTFIFENERDTRWDCPACKHNYLISKHRGRTPPSLGFSGPSGPDDWMR